MSKLSRSPQRHSFHKERELKKLEENPNDQGAKDMLEFYDDWDQKELVREQDLEWQKNNMEYDLRSCDWILKKVRESSRYAQNLYAAMCNMDWQKLSVVPILKEERWSCSWRYAGGIIANMREEGDYIDWYCSGISDPEGYVKHGVVSEGTVTQEIKEDLQKLGWVPIEE